MNTARNIWSGNLLILLALVFLQCRPDITAAELSTDLQFVHYNIKDGLSQSTVLAIYQDTYGFLWLGTRDGLNLFDGYDFKVYQHRPGDTASIGDNFILDITGDRSGNLWIATSDGLSFFDRDNETFQKFMFPGAVKDPEIRCVYIDKDSTIW